VKCGVESRAFAGTPFGIPERRQRHPNGNVAGVEIANRADDIGVATAQREVEREFLEKQRLRLACGR
jgi:hypothetical protein